MNDQSSVWIIDAGNTRIKLRELHGERTVRSIVLYWPLLTSEFIESNKNIFNKCRAILTKVASHHSLTLLLTQFEKVIEINHQLIKQHFGFNTEYIDPNQLGIDRLLASLGARLLFESPNLAVINAGTATTVELINNQTHKGGMIIAGNQLMLNSLFTAQQLPKLNVDRAIKIGKDSYNCMQTGLAFMNQGLVLAIVKEYKVDNLIICGGNANQFANMDTSIHIIPDLIMQTLTKLSTRLL
ncbi:type III pantothenate kinase [Marinicellulosiphila megalodicopiae]|uniref:type III pantothenate kinase n=1 Tax=Marinicellulosiphila megalodicopiae TaxID=2724896 RepID=UPI003BAE25CE